ncbi:MAG TPA: ATP-binding cassette domain-containing protein [Acidimicrobiia bacterium]|jgi:putative ABC transport system ATP-binding protein|nr:ATP-binding cassette domain-containing protein [Acidimicrobiia bacterium]
MSEPTLAARQLEKTYGEDATLVHAVRHVDFEVEPGEVVLIMGPSGSGKTTLLSMLGAMLRPTSGEVLVNGVDIAAVPEARLPKLRATTFGFVFQDFNLLGALTALENVELALNLAGTSGRTARERAEELLARLGLAGRLTFRPDQLSGGEKQRVAIARALANQPPVILADEPTANLDSKIGHEIARLLRAIATEEQRAVVMVSHDSRLKEVADRVVWLEDGVFRDLDDMTTDPVCGMSVHSEGAPHLQAEEGILYFCSRACRDEYAAASVSGRPPTASDVNIPNEA